MGGIMGYLSYETARYWADFSHLAPPHVNVSDLIHNPSGLPDICFGVYDRVLRHHHPTNTTELIVRQDITGDSFSISDFQKRYQDRSLPVSPAQSEFALTSSMNMPAFTQYQEKFDAIKRWIQNGHAYQINLSEQFKVNYRGDIRALYLKLRKNTPAPFAAYLNYPFVQICSASPELMVSKIGGHICSRPIKGTIHRDPNHVQDLKNQHALFHSEKDRAELTMIVDLIRNDLRRICQTGSITVDWVNNHFHRIETFSHLHHLVADVRGKRIGADDLVMLLQSVFPGGSITGAPKIRAAELISKIENVPRFIYTGSIGYLGFDGDVKLNIAIRTLYAHNKTIYFHSGSGIVADSTAPAEWDEIQLKAEGIYTTLCHANTLKEFHHASK
jgi:para-aminobenzoate synthetase component 1